MSENRPPSHQPPLPDEGKGTEAFPEAASDIANDSPNRGLWEKIQTPLLRVVAVLGALFFLLALLTSGAAVYTSRPEFCRSCHIMEPYVRSWEHSTHADVTCVKCHFPPGLGEKVRGKMAGLVQLAKYVTSSEGPRPVAEIPDASCLRSGCHETRLLAGKVEFEGVLFDHQPHLENPRRGKELRCTSCHSQIVQGTHMAVTPSTCYLCHFKDQHLNEGLGTCTRCHQIPDKEFELGGGVKFHHEVAYERGVDCANCHADLIRGNGEVPPERCGVCHNRVDDLVRIDDHEFLHNTHVTEHKVDCLECHLTIQHALDPHKIEEAAADCKSCHPDHHHEQVNLLQGKGAKTMPALSGGMAMVRVACPSCHRVKEVSPTGTVLIKASIETCLNCHDESAAARLVSYYETLNASLSEIESHVIRVQEALESADLDAERSTEMRERLDKLAEDLNFLRVGNGIHNIHFAGTLAHALVDQLTSLCRDLKLDEPKVVLPEDVHLTE